MKALYSWLNLLVCGLVLSTAACTVSFPDELPYACETDADCGGKGYVCTSLPDARRYCCKPEPAELCNSLDDDCDGEIDELESTTCYTGPDNTRNVGACRAGKPSCGEGGNIACTGQVLPSTEICNGKDDDCDGTVDEGFDFLTGHDTCGRCDQKCSATQDCIGGLCTGRREAACDNGADDDSDGPIDCADTDCNALPCGPNCVCLGGKKGEAVCDNNVDDDGDSTAGTTDKLDCADSDCDGKSCANADCGGRLCGTGCICLGLKKGEGACGNGVDDDGDGATLIDCKDPDCDTKECGAGCLCSLGNKTEVDCGNNVDDDGDSTVGTTDKVDCRDSDCSGKECGVGCLCSGSVKVEAACQDGLDNDGDNLIDCEDPQCDGQSCLLGGQPGGATCKRKQCQENNCTDGEDNDKNGKTDCEDPGCEGVAHILARQVCTLGSPGPQEVNCTNNQDDDADGKIDCRTQGQGSEPNCLDGVCGVGCKYNNTPGSACTAKIEVFCDDGVNNDGDGTFDCADTADCEGKPCNTAPGVLGCTCVGGNRKETRCADRKDNDYDTLTDCADTTDCTAGMACTKDDGTAGTCGSGKCN